MTVTQKPIYITSDKNYGYTKDWKIINHIADLLTKAGFNVKYKAYGSNSHYSTALKMVSDGVTEGILFNLFNGADPVCMKEFAVKGYDGPITKKYLSTKNTTVMAWFEGAGDFYNPTGKYYKKLVLSGDYSTTKVLNYPLKTMQDAGIKVIYEKTDYTGDKVAADFIKIFNGSGTDDTKKTDTNTDNNNKETTKTDTTNPYHITLTDLTDGNGVFSKPINLPYVGQYKVRYRYAGSLEYAGSSLYVDIINNTAGKQVIPINPDTNNTDNNNNNTNNSPQKTGTGYNPEITTDIISLVNNAPDITKFSNMKFADTQATYTLTREELDKAMQRDRQCIYFYKALPRYVYFKKQSDETYYVLPREKWYTILHDFHKKMLLNRYNVLLGNSKPYKERITAYPETITSNLKDRHYHTPLVRDLQNDTSYNYGSCGQTSLSMCTQMLFSYYNEGDIAREEHRYHNYTTYDYHKNFVEMTEHQMAHSDIFFDMDTALTALKNHYPVMINIPHHFSILCDYSLDDKKVAVANPTTTGFGGLSTNWHTLAEVKNKLSHGMMIIKPNYPHATQKDQNIAKAYLENFGGAWTRTETYNFTQEVVDNSGQRPK